VLSLLPRLQTALALLLLLLLLSQYQNYHLKQAAERPHTLLLQCWVLPLDLPHHCTC
jgi:hypothetical protein